MKLNWAEKCVANNPLRVLEQLVEVGWLKATMPLEEGAKVLEVGCGRGAYFMEELYPTLYKNVITKHILFHPRIDRFYSSDLRQELQSANMPIKEAVEHRKLGILAVAVRQK